NRTTPTGLRPHCYGRDIRRKDGRRNPVGVDVSFTTLPRVARSARNRWALGRNPFGIFLILKNSS
ncbi:MAG: hypothetical protein SFY80_12140, partial [Verrucomicrobiota bacterium]|nr:hypothetical protein [Verrucomicrobiota bacterium]